MPAVQTAVGGAASAVVSVDLTDFTLRDGPSAIASSDADTIATNTTGTTVNSAGANDGSRFTLSGIDITGARGIRVTLGVTTWPTGGSGLRGLVVQVQDGTVQGTAVGGRAAWTYATATSRHQLDVDDALWTAFSSTNVNTTVAVEMEVLFFFGTTDGGSDYVQAGLALLYDADGEIIHKVGGPLGNNTWSPSGSVTLEIGVQDNTGSALTWDGISISYEVLT